MSGGNRNRGGELDDINRSLENDIKDVKSVSNIIKRFFGGSSNNTDNGSSRDNYSNYGGAVNSGQNIINEPLRMTNTASRDYIFSSQVGAVTTPPQPSQNETGFIYFCVDAQVKINLENNQERIFVSTNGQKWLRLPDGSISKKNGNSLLVKCAMPSGAISSDNISQTGVLFLNFANPYETFDQYLERRVNERIYQIKQQEVARQEAERRRNEEIHRQQQANEEQRRIAEEQARAAAMPQYPTMEEIFNKVRMLRRDPNTSFLMLDSGSCNFSYTMSSENSNSPYLRCVDEHNNYIVLPNQVSAFNYNEIDISVYECNDGFIDESFKLKEPCIVSPDNRILQKGIISR